MQLINAASRLLAITRDIKIMAKNKQARPLVNPTRGKLTPISLALYDDQFDFIEQQSGISFADKTRAAIDFAMNAKCNNDLIEGNKNDNIN